MNVKEKFLKTDDSPEDLQDPWDELYGENYQEDHLDEYDTEFEDYEEVDYEVSTEELTEIVKKGSLYKMGDNGEIYLNLTHMLDSVDLKQRNLGIDLYDEDDSSATRYLMQAQAELNEAIEELGPNIFYKFWKDEKEEINVDSVVEEIFDVFVFLILSAGVVGGPGVDKKFAEIGEKKLRYNLVRRDHN